MDSSFETIKEIYSSGERFDEMSVYTNRRLKIWEEKAAVLFPNGAKILDIGCGKGREAFCLNDKGFQVTGIDISETVIEAAKKITEAHKLSIDFFVSDGISISFPDSVFDVVIIWAQTFGLFYGENNQLKILSECKRVLKADGILSFSGHDKEVIYELQKKHPKCINKGYFYPFYDASELHYTMFNIDELSDLAKKAGLTIINCGAGKIYTEKDGTVLHCICKK